MPPWSLGWHVERYRASRQISEIEEAAGQDPWNEQIQNMDKAWVSGVQFGKKKHSCLIGLPIISLKISGNEVGKSSWLAGKSPAMEVSSRENHQLVDLFIARLSQGMCLPQNANDYYNDSTAHVFHVFFISCLLLTFFLSRCFCLPAFVFRISISCFSFDVLLWLDAFLVAMFLPFWLLLGFGLLQMTSISMNMGPWTGSCTPVNYCKSLLQDRAPNS